MLLGQSFATAQTCSAPSACTRSISSNTSSDLDTSRSVGGLVLLAEPRPWRYVAVRVASAFAEVASLQENRHSQRLVGAGAATKQDYKTKAIEVGNFKTYTHKQNIFSVSMPTSWRRKDTSKPDEVIVTWEDRTGNAVVSVDIFDNTPDSEITNTPESLGRFMTKTINEVYKKNLKNVTVSEPDDLKNGVVRVSWAYESESNGQTVPMSGTSFIRLDRNRISIFTDIIPTEQFEPLRTALDKMVQSFTVNTDRSFPKP
jgi:PsbP